MEDNETGKPKVVALAGPNGAGKTTTGPALLRDTLGVRMVVNADTIARGLAGFAPEAAAVLAGRILLEQIDRLARRRQSFAFETTFSGRAYARRLRALIHTGYDFYVVFLWLPSPELAIARVADRVRRGGHDIPAEVIRRRYRSGLRHFFRLYKPLAHGWRLYDSSIEERPLIASGTRAQGEKVFDEMTWRKVTAVGV